MDGRLHRYRDGGRGVDLQLHFWNIQSESALDRYPKLSWAALSSLLTQHEFGQKEGSCIVPAIFSGERRTKHEARRIELVLLDSDAGSSLDEISLAIQKHGWAAVISSTYSHKSTRTTVNRHSWRKYQASAGDDERAATAFLVREKHYLPRVAQGAWVLAEDESLGRLRAPALPEVPYCNPAEAALALLRVQ